MGLVPAAQAGQGAERAGADRVDAEPGLRRVHAGREARAPRRRPRKTRSAEQLFFILRDQTSGKETYGAGRFLYADLPKAGKVVLDFNKAYNPPCAFTPYATCPLPPPQNWMPVRVEAGELTYGKGH